MKVNHENINQFIADRFGAGAKVIGKLESGKIVIRTSSGATTTFSESQVSNHTITQGERTKRQHNSDMAAKAKELNRQENEVKAQAKADAQAEISESIQRQRDRRDSENKFASDYNV